MALIKSKELSNGVIGEYWKIEVVKISKEVLHVVLVLYVNQSVRNANKAPLMSQELSFSCSLNDYTSNPFAIAYQKIKESRLVTTVISQAVPAVMGKETVLVTPEIPESTDENGVTTPAIPAVYEERDVVITPAIAEVTGTTETNWFADAIDC